MNDLTKNQGKNISNYIPVAISKLALSACLSQYPLALATVSFVEGMSNELISLRNEDQLKKLLNQLNEKVDSLSRKQKITKKNLSTNVGYQEVAHKRLLAISALDDDRDLELSASLIAICSMLTGDDSRDKYLLNAVGEISSSELKLLLLGFNKRQEFERKKENDDCAGRDAQVEKEFLDRFGIEFFDEGQELIGLEDFSHLITKLHSLGLIEDQSRAGFASYNQTKKMTPPNLTTVGKYLIDLMKTVKVSS